MNRHLQRLKTEYTLEAIGKAAGVSKQAVGKWKKVPAERLPALCKELGKAPYELRPDLYPRPGSKP